MAKKQMGPQTWIYPAPALLVGANVDGKPNFMALAWGGIVNSEPPMISVALRHQRHTLKGIRQNMAFSVNIPSTDMVKETDYCGMVSGSKVNKVETCRFNVFYGKLGNAPLIEQCPVNMECRVEQMLTLPTHTVVIGRIEETHFSESCLTDGKPDVARIKPFAYVMPGRQYQAMGEVVAEAYSAGKSLK